jgi:hypothetical protein
VSNTGLAACGYSDVVIDACDGPGSCANNAGTLEHTVPEFCGTTGGASCRYTQTTCTDKGPTCSSGQLTTYGTACDPTSGCSNPPTVSGCPSAPSTCDTSGPLQHVTHLATCADAASCVPSPEVRTTCALQMCVGNDWVTYSAASCDPTTGCSGTQVATQDCTIGTTHHCVSYTQMERTTCGCVPGVGCQCSTITETCPDKDDQCVGTSGKTLRTYQPHCDSYTDTCTWNAPDTSCAHFCQVRAGPDVCY